jgi:excinuclease UvrABC nuclease subunit
MSDANRDKFDSGRYDQLVDQVMDSLDGASEVTLEKLTAAVNEAVESRFERAISK